MYNENVRSNVDSLRVRVSALGTQTEISTISFTHYHDELEFLLIERGQMEIDCVGGHHSAKAGQVVFINSRVPHATTCVTPNTSYGLLQFREKDFLPEEDADVLRYFACLHRTTESPFCLLDDARVAGLVHDILVEGNEKRQAHALLMRGGVICLLGALVRLGVLTDTEALGRTPQLHKILPALSFIHEKYAQDISLDVISARLGFDPSYFCRIFKAAVGATPVEYLNFVRVCKAEKLLASTDMSILEVSGAVGISSVSYFNRIFKRYNGIAPTQFRRFLYCNM